MDVGMKEGATREGTWPSEASLAIVGLLNTHGLASASPVPPAYKARGDVQRGAKRPRVPNIPTASSFRSNRRPAATWHTVGGNRGGVISPRRPRYVRIRYLPSMSVEIYVELHDQEALFDPHRRLISYDVYTPGIYYHHFQLPP